MPKLHPRWRGKSKGRKELPRTPSGALSRSAERYTQEARMTEQEARVVALDARQRVHGLNAEAAGLAEAGSSLGRLYLARAITKRLYEAGNRFAEDVWSYHMATGITHPSPKAVDYGRVKGRAMDRSQDAVRSITTRYMGLLGAIQQADRSGKPIETTVRNVVVLDLPADNWPDHMIAMLRVGLEAIAGWYGIPEQAIDRPAQISACLCSVGDARPRNARRSDPSGRF